MNSSSPFSSSNQGADIILRTSDAQDLYTHRVLLERSSAMFREMFSLPQPPSAEETIQVVVVSETADVWIALLTWIDPSCTVNFDRLTIDNVGLLLDIVDKYTMDAVRDSLISLLKVKQWDAGERLWIWSIAVRLRDRQWAKDLSPSVISTNFHKIRESPVLNFVSGTMLLRLIQYQQRCSEQASKLFRQRDEGSRVQLAANATVHLDSTCICPRIFYAGDANYATWFCNYLDLIQKKLEEKPGKEALQGVLFEAYDALASAFACQCCSLLVRKLDSFNGKMGEYLEEAIEKVEVPEFV